MTDLDKALELARAVTKLAAGFPGHFFHDPECTDLVYIATDCEKQQCDCSVGEDCAVIVGACDGIDDVAEPLAQLLNAAGPLARALLALHTTAQAMAAVVEAAEAWRDTGCGPMNSCNVDHGDECRVPTIDDALITAVTTLRTAKGER